MFEVIILVVLAIVWMVFAAVQDIRTREIANWLNFSLIVFALGFRFFYSLFGESGFGFFYQGLIGLGIFFILGNLFYYSRIFAGGDAKLLMALGAILPFTPNFYLNLQTFILFFVLFLVTGSLYGLIFSLVLVFKNPKKFRKEFLSRFKSNKKLFYFSMVIGLVLMLLSFNYFGFLFFGMFVFILPYLYFYAKSADEACMIKKISGNKLREGDWLYKEIRVGKKLIKASWEGVTKKEIMVLKNKKNILIRQGIPFSPVFLIAFVILIWIWFFDLGFSLW